MKYCWIYILECDNGHYYTGYAENLVRRYNVHQSGREKAKYTRSFKPVRIAQCWRLFDRRGTALKVEHLIKGMDRSLKESIIEEPENLKGIISVKLGLDLRIFTFDPQIVEEKSLDFSGKSLKELSDPFKDFPMRDF